MFRTILIFMMPKSAESNSPWIGQISISELIIYYYYMYHFLPLQMHFSHLAYLIGPQTGMNLSLPVARHGKFVRLLAKLRFSEQNFSASPSLSILADFSCPKAIYLRFCTRDLSIWQDFQLPICSTC